MIIIISVKIIEQGWHLLLRILILLFCSAIRSILELYSCQLFHSCLPCYLSDEIKCIQRHAMHFIFLDLKYSSVLREGGIPTLYDRREKLSCDLFKDIMYKDHKLSSLVPPKNTNNLQTCI